MGIEWYTNYYYNQQRIFISWYIRAHTFCWTNQPSIQDLKHWDSQLHIPVFKYKQTLHHKLIHIS